MLIFTHKLFLSGHGFDFGRREFRHRCSCGHGLVRFRYFRSDRASRGRETSVTQHVHKLDHRHQTLPPRHFQRQGLGEHQTHVLVLVAGEYPRGQTLGPTRTKTRTDVILGVVKYKFISLTRGNGFIMNQQQSAQNFAALPPFQISALGELEGLKKLPNLQRVAHTAHSSVFTQTILGLARNVGAHIKRDGISIRQYWQGLAPTEGRNYFSALRFAIPLLDPRVGLTYQTPYAPQVRVGGSEIDSLQLLKSFQMTRFPLAITQISVAFDDVGIGTRF